MGSKINEKSQKNESSKLKSKKLPVKPIITKQNGLKNKIEKLTGKPEPVELSDEQLTKILLQAL